MQAMTNRSTFDITRTCWPTWVAWQRASACSCCIAPTRACSWCITPIRGCRQACYTCHETKNEKTETRHGLWMTPMNTTTMCGCSDRRAPRAPGSALHISCRCISQPRYLRLCFRTTPAASRFHTFIHPPPCCSELPQQYHNEPLSA